MINNLPRRTWTLFADYGWDSLEGLRRGVRILVSNGLIADVQFGAVRQPTDLHRPRTMVFPAFGNGHDHLKYHWPQRVGGAQYGSSYDWIPELQSRAHSGFLRDHTVQDLYLLGVYANIFAGVSTVINHARTPPVVDLVQLPMRVPNNFRRELMFIQDRNEIVWEHRMGQGAVQESLLAESEDRPFVVHIAEGNRADTANEVAALAKAGALNRHCILAHSINVDDEQIDLIAEAGASVVWCPSSNMYLFGQTAPVDKMLRAGVNVLLGTDSPCSGSGSLRAELQLAARLLQAVLKCSEDEASAYCLRMVTSNFGKAFPDLRVGRLTAGFSADLALFRFEGGVPGLGEVAFGGARPEFVTASGAAILSPRQWHANGQVEHWSPETTALVGSMEEFIVGGDAQMLLHRVAALSGRPASFFPLHEDLERL